VGTYASFLALRPDPIGGLLFALPIVAIPVLFWVFEKPAAWLVLFLFAAIALPPLPFAIGDSGPHPGIAIAALGAAVGLLRIDEWRLNLGSIPKRMILFAAVLLASVAMALAYSGWGVALGSLSRVFLFCISIYVFLYGAYGPAADSSHPFRVTRFLFWTATASALFACLDFYFQFPPPAGYGPQFIWLSSGVFRRAQGVFYEASTLGNFCVFFLIMIAAALFRPRSERPLPRAALLAGGVVFSAALLLSFSRSSLVNLGVSVCALLFVHRKQVAWKRLFVRAALAVGGFVVAISVALPTFAELYWTRIFNSFAYFAESPNGILSGRVDSWAYLVQFLGAHPLFALFGLGYKTLPYSEFAGRTVIADNMYLSLLVETGVAGLLAMLGLSVAILRESRRAAASANTQASFFGTWIFCFWCGEMVQMLSGDILTYWRVLPLYFWVLAMAVRPR
jgi:O-antigen ligase